MATLSGGSPGGGLAYLVDRDTQYMHEKDKEDAELDRLLRPHKRLIVASSTERMPSSSSSSSSFSYLDFSWKEFFREPYQWWDNRNRKTNPRSPDFNVKFTKDSLWIVTSHVQEDLKERGSQEIYAWTEGEEEKEEDEGEGEGEGEGGGGGGEENRIKGKLLLGIKEEEKSLKGMHSRVQEVMEMEEEMPSSNSTYRETHRLVALLKVCAKKRDLHRGSETHANIANTQSLKNSVFIGSALISMYAKCGSLAKAQQVFDKFAIPSVVLCNAIIAGYAQHGHGAQALSIFEGMQCGGLSPNEVTFLCILKACGSIQALQKGQEIHTRIVIGGFLGKNVVGNAVVDMYAKCGFLAEAAKVFYNLPGKDVVSWNAMIAGSVRNGHAAQALRCFEQMQIEGYSPNAATFVSILKACGSVRDACKGQAIYTEIVKEGLLEGHIIVGNALVHMYAKCGLLTKAQEIFVKLPARDVVLWNALIGGYTQHGHDVEALSCFEQMKLEGLLPDAVTFICILRACGGIGAADKGQEIHAEIVRQKLLEKHVAVGNALIDMYVKCGLLVRAQEAFDKLPGHDVISWNVLIAGYAQHGRAEQVLCCFKRMILEGFSPDAITFVCVLKACGSLGAASKGQEIHAEIVRKKMLQKHIIVGNALVDMYSKCGLLTKAAEVFDKLPVRNEVSWNALTLGYAQHGNAKEAFSCFNNMRREGFFPNAGTIVYILKACGSIGARDKGEEIHADILREGLLESYTVVGNALVDMYSKCGLLGKAQKAFDKLPVRDIVSWNVLITGYAQHGHGEQALSCFEEMQREGLSPDAVTFICALKACSSIGATDKGQEIHAEILGEGLLEKDLILGNALVDMYAKSGFLAKAQEVFDMLPVRDVISWNAMITGYALHGQAEKALNSFQQMQLEGLSPNNVTFVGTLKACGSIATVDKGQEIHIKVVRQGLLEKDLFVGNALVGMYAKCGFHAKAAEMFEKIPSHDVVSWNALITGYTQHGLSEKALDCFARMEREGLIPDAVTCVCILKACGSIGATSKGEEIHSRIVRDGLLVKNSVIGTALVDMYAKCGLLAKAQEVFNELLVRDVVLWNSLITGYTQHGHTEQALECLEEMQLEGQSPDAVTFLCIMKACGSLGAAQKGREVHAALSSKGLLESDILVGNALVDMYAKCGLLAKAQEVFGSLPLRDVVSWNALITGYALLGRSESVFMLLDKMIGESFEPDAVTFISVLCACTHTGLLEKGVSYFETMSRGYDIIPNLEHITCIVDLFGRAGHLDKAVAVIKTMPVYPNPMMWNALLGACRKWGNTKLGKLAFKLALQVDEGDGAAYVCISNIYSDGGPQED